MVIIRPITLKKAKDTTTSVPYTIFVTREWAFLLCMKRE